MEDKTYPNLLFITGLDIFKVDVSSSLTIRSFLGDWPQENVYQIVCTDDDNNNVSSNNVFYLKHSDIRIGHFRRLSKKNDQSVIKQKIDQRIETKKVGGVKKNLVSFIKDVYSLFPYKINKQLRRFLIQAKPDVIYTCSFSPRVYFLIHRLHLDYGIPYILHFYDDWPNVIYKDTVLSKSIYFWFSRYINKMVNKSGESFCISELMCETYKERYKYDRFLPLMHSVESDLTEVNKPHSNKYIVYAGSLYLGRYEAILSFCRYLEDKDFLLYIYTNQKQWNEIQPLFEKYPFVRFGGYVSQNELQLTINNADALLFVESFEENFLDYTRLSMSTKIPEYLVSGKPIIALGNINQGSIYYLQKHKAAYVVTQENQLGPVLNDFFEKRNLTEILAHAKTLFEQNHLLINQQKLFYDEVVKIVGQHKLMS